MLRTQHPTNGGDRFRRMGTQRPHGASGPNGYSNLDQAGLRVGSLGAGLSDRKCPYDDLISARAFAQGMESSTVSALSKVRKQRRPIFRQKTFPPWVNLQTWDLALGGVWFVPKDDD